MVRERLLDLIHRLSGQPWAVERQGNHAELGQVGSQRLTLPRDTEINEDTARSVLAYVDRWAAGGGGVGHRRAACRPGEEDRDGSD